MCDSDKEVEDIKTEENVENDEASKSQKTS